MSAGAKWLAMVLPAPCLGCGAAESGPLRLCGACALSLSPITEDCTRCGAPIAQAGTCAACAVHPPKFTRKAVWRYGEAGASLMGGYKSRGRYPLAAPLVAAAIAARPELAPFATGCEVLVAIPSPWWRRLRRGYNPAGLLAAALAREWALPVARRALRVRRLVRQTGRSGAARRRLGRAFAPGPGAFALRGKIVLLVDDVETTGATLRAAALELKRAGAREIRALAFFRVTKG